MKDTFIPTAAGVEAYAEHLKMIMELGYATGRGDKKKIDEILNGKVAEDECYHQCSGNCRRVGCNCECGEWHKLKET